MSISGSKIFLLNVVELCAIVFRGPDLAVWEAMHGSGVPQLMDSVQRYSGFPAAPVRDLQAALAGCDRNFEDLETEFVRLFVASPGGVPAPLYESCHGHGQPRTMGPSALDMRDRLAAAGLAVDLDSNEPPDHLSIELEYLYHLLATGWSDGDPSLAVQGIEFAETIMLPWVRRFRDALIKADPHPVFLAVADIALAALVFAPDA